MRHTGHFGDADAEAFELEADTLRALAHPKRLMILSRLGSLPRSVTELADALDMSLPNASQHLRVLRDRGIVRAERTGHVVRYRLSNPAFHRCCIQVRQAIVEEARRREAEFRSAPPSGKPIDVEEVPPIPA